MCEYDRTASELISCIWPLSIIMHKFQIHNNLTLSVSLCFSRVLRRLVDGGAATATAVIVALTTKLPLIPVQIQICVMLNLIFSTTKNVTYSMVILASVFFALCIVIAPISLVCLESDSV